MVPVRPLVPRRKIVLECRDRRLDAFGSGQQFLPERCQTVAAKVALDEPAADPILKLRNATLHR